MIQKIKQQITRNNLWYIGLSVILFNTACERDNYYFDGGLANPFFEGSVMEYLDSKPIEFDTIAQIVRLAGMEEVFQDHEFTFFAPTDESIKRLIGAMDRGGLNQRLFQLGRDTIVHLSEIDPLIWRSFLERHMFRGRNKLMDYPQIDLDMLTVFPGENYYSLSNDVINIGVIFHDAGSIKYLGYRQLIIRYIADVSRLDDDWNEVRVASSDVQPNNGVVHVLNVNDAQFGFSHEEVATTIVNSRR